ncbi:MAG: hypothetical protein H7841_03400 [Magnetospirillum sp. WYHS-4]
MKIDRNASYLDLFSSHSLRSPAAVDPSPAPPPAPQPDLPPIGKSLVKLEAEADTSAGGRSDLPAVTTPPPLPIATGEVETVPSRAEEGPLADILRGVNVRRMSPREMANLSQDLYAAGVLSWDEYSMLAYQSELQPGYDRTVGALTGQPAQPDKPRDFIALWEDRLAFEERHNPADSRQIQTSRHILTVLKQIASPTNFVV